MKQKLELLSMGYAFTTLNILLIDTRFNIIGMGFGIVAAIFFIQALRIKND